MYLIGEPILVRPLILQKRMGEKVKYILEEERNYFDFPRDGQITSVENGYVEFDYNRELIKISDIFEMVVDG